MFRSIIPTSQTFNYQIVRWRRPRKPFWLGIAKTKMFVVPQPKKILTPEEKKEYILFEHHHSTAMKSLLKFIREDNPKLKETISSTVYNEESNEVLQKMMAESMKVNEAWNAESERLRNERIKIKMTHKIERAIREISEYEENRLAKLDALEKIVREEKHLGESFITPEHLDEEIEKCLSKVECYDFAIDLEGNKYPGREPLESPGKRSLSSSDIKDLMSLKS